MYDGWIKLHRKSIDNPVFKNHKAWHYFSYCLLMAQHKPKKILWNKKDVFLERGEFVTGRRQASIDTGLSEQTIRTAQKILEAQGMVVKSTSKSTSKYSVLTVVNYSDYQPEENKSTSKSTSNQPASNHIQEVKEGKEGLKKEPNTPLPPLGGDKPKRPLRPKRPKAKLSGDNLANFKLFWSTYPKKKGLSQAETTWLKLVPLQVSASHLMALLREDLTGFKASDRQMIPFPSSWLNKRFKDGLEKQSKGQPKKSCVKLFKRDPGHPERLVCSDGFLYDLNKKRIMKSGFPVGAPGDTIKKLFGGE